MCMDEKERKEGEEKEVNKLKGLLATSLLLIGLLTGCGNDPYITVKEFKKLEKGMTAKKVEKIIGGAEHGACEQRWFDDIDGMYNCIYMAEDGFNYASVVYDSEWRVVYLWHSEID